MKRDARDAAFSLMIRERDRFTCQRCGAVHARNSRGMHSAHCFGRGKLATRFEPDNAVALCYGCHSYLDQHPGEKHEFVRARLGDERYAALQLRSNNVRRIA